MFNIRLLILTAWTISSILFMHIIAKTSHHGRVEL